MITHGVWSYSRVQAPRDSLEIFVLHGGVSIICLLEDEQDPSMGEFDRAFIYNVYRDY